MIWSGPTERQTIYLMGQYAPPRLPQRQKTGGESKEAEAGASIDLTSGVAMFSLAGKVAVVTGGYGVLGSSWCKGLAACGAKVAVLGRRQAAAEPVLAAIAESGGEAMFVQGDVMDKASLEAACALIVAAWGKVDILVNGAGGNQPKATVGPSDSFFDVPKDAMDTVVSLNLMGTVIPSQVFGAEIAKHGYGSILNISSMSAQLPLTRVLGYSAAKAAVDNFTRWLATEVRWGERGGAGGEARAGRAGKERGYGRCIWMCGCWKRRPP